MGGLNLLRRTGEGKKLERAVRGGKKDEPAVAALKRKQKKQANDLQIPKD